MIAAAKAQGLRTTAEVTPQHLYFWAPDCYDRIGTLAQMNPPIRSREHQQGLWKALEAGVFDVFGSDHAPHTLAEKAQPFPGSPSGMPGVQTMLSVLLTFAHEGKLSLQTLVRMACEKPAELYGISGKGQIAEGFDADLTIVDPNRTAVFERSMVQSKCGWSPYEGERLTGWVEHVVLGGKSYDPGGSVSRFTLRQNARLRLGPVKSSSVMPKLILVRPRQSWRNLEDRFPGWVAGPLTPQGREEAAKAGAKLIAFKIDVAYTSVLTRAQDTLSLILEAMGVTTPTIRDVALNERHYGDLQGLNKAQTAEKFGKEQVHIWRRSYDVPPPNGESLEMTAARTLPFFERCILGDIQQGNNVLVVAHGNSNRSIVMKLDNLSKEQVLELNLGTAVPVVYELDRNGSVVSKEIL